MTASSSDTIVAIATAQGRGGVAVVRVSGPDAFRIAEAVTHRTVAADCAGRFFYSRFHSQSQTVDDGLLLVFASPHSYTGEDVVELQGHGGSVAPRRVLEACVEAGARLARRGEFTQRAFLNGRLDLGAAEAVIDLVDARTERAADDAIARFGGAAATALEKLYLSAIDISSQVEHSLDFSEDELPVDFGERLISAVGKLLGEVRSKLSTAREGHLLRTGALVVLAGVPNAGKSSLLNALLGTGRAIVSDEAGTTRDAIEEWMEVEGWPVRLVDTAGLRKAEGAIEAEGVTRAEKFIADADVVLRVTPCDADGEIHAPDKKEICIVSKCDLAETGSVRFGNGLRVSSKTGEGIAGLKTALAKKLAEISAKESGETGADVTTRQKECLISGEASLERAHAALAAGDWVIAANELRDAAQSLGRILGKVYSDDLLDALFSRFCIGK